MPKASSSEIEEYNDLMRALKTGELQDLTSLLIQHIHEDTKAKLVRTQAQAHNRDYQTRWPLLDAPPAEWELEDEIGVMIRRQIDITRGPTNSNRPVSSFSDSEFELNDLDLDLDSDSEDENYIEEMKKVVTPMVIEFMERIFELIEAHVVRRTQSVANKINPLGWHDLANMMSSPMAIDFVELELMETFVNRMEGILGTPVEKDPFEPCPRRAMERRRYIERNLDV